MHSIVTLLLLAAVNGPDPSGAANRPRVVILDVSTTGIDPSLAVILTEILTSEADAVGTHSVIAGRDVASMMEFEKQKELVGCDDVGCLAELGGALGVEFVVASDIAAVGKTFVVNVKLIDIARAKVDGRAYETVRGETDEVIGSIRKAVRRLFHRSRPPSHDATVAASTEEASAAKPAAAATESPSVFVTKAHGGPPGSSASGAATRVGRATAGSAQSELPQAKAAGNSSGSPTKGDHTAMAAASPTSGEPQSTKAAVAHPLQEPPSGRSGLLVGASLVGGLGTMGSSELDFSVTAGQGSSDNHELRNAVGMQVYLDYWVLSHFALGAEVSYMRVPIECQPEWNRGLPSSAPRCEGESPYSVKMFTARASTRTGLTNTLDLEARLTAGIAGQSQDEWRKEWDRYYHEETGHIVSTDHHAGLRLGAALGLRWYVGPRLSFVFDATYVTWRTALEKRIENWGTTGPTMTKDGIGTEGIVFRTDEKTSWMLAQAGVAVSL